MTAPTIDRASYQAAVEQIRSQIVSYARAVWATATLTDETIARLVELLAPAVVAGQMQTAELTSVYLAAATGTEPLAVDPAVTLGRGVPNEVVYARPVIQARSLVAKGRPVAEAFDAGARRLESIATTDLQMAKVRQADRSLQHAGRTFYRRVPQGSHTCAMCLIASTQRYKVGRLMPMHPGCDCGIGDIPDGMDLDEMFDTDRLLEATHAKVREFTEISDRGGRAVDYRKLLITQEHGELGPVLTWRRQAFTSADDLK